MDPSLIPFDETERLAALHDYQLLDSDPEAGFDDLTQLAASILNVPCAAISLIDADRQWFKSKVNIPVDQTPRDVAFCAHTILGNDLMIVPDTLSDPRFVHNPLCEQLAIRFYAGAPLRSPEGLAVGSLCVIDHVPHTLSVQQREALRSLGRQAECQMNLRRAMRKIAISERYARSTVDALGAHIAIIDPQGVIQTVNLAWRQLAQSAESSIAAGGDIGTNYLSLCDRSSSPDAPALAAGIRQVIDGAQPAFSLEYAVDLPSQRSWYLARATRFAGVGPTRLVISHENVSDRRAATEKIIYDSRHDALTGLPNRMLFAERLEQSLKSVGRSRSSVGVLFLDLDRFKLINDSLGHAAGDAVLSVITERIKSCLRTSDVLARMGGDEFTILLEDLHNAAEAARVAKRICQAVAVPIDFQGNELAATASIGIVAIAGGSSAYSTARDVLRDADAAMYKAKAAGKDRFVVFDQAMHAEVVTRMRIEAELRRAVDRQELELHYQPILKLAEQSVCGFEALVRWRRPIGLVSPADFIPVAEDTGLIVSIGNWVLRHACWQLAQWRESPALRDWYVTVNVSRRQLSDGQFANVVQDVLNETGVPAGAVVLEITETAIMDNPAAARAMMQRLRGLGVRLAIDDFGTGYSSLSCLQEFPLNLLKIDRSFIQSAVDDRQAAVLQSVIDLSHRLNMTVVAEGVETVAQAELLQSCGCDLTQGYLFSKPVPAAQAALFGRKLAA